MRIDKLLMRIGGQSAHPTSQLITHVYTKGSVGNIPGMASVGAVIRHDKHRDLVFRKSYVPATSFTEAIWAATAYGLESAIKEGHSVIGLGTSDYEILQAMMNPLGAQEYRTKIYQMAAKTDWTGICWVPSDANKANMLIR